ncbi:SseB family protein [uncultured Tessaracoccus sp.]|uniref:SseB family protein n=1 Tax=uncultured Tessaracoccus sp. TaxID=905023 RepID=UPI0025DDD1B0|nr:SseB family protein [uncultured Tessaracoccus sp.]
MSKLANPSARFRDDHGDADPITRAAIAKVTDERSYARALVALCSSRLLMPIVASGDETDHPDPKRWAEMAAVSLVTDDGQALLAFTGLDSMQQWRPDARPVPCTLDELCATVAEAGANQLLIDCAGPRSIVVTGEPLRLFAQGYAMAEFEDEGFAWVRYAAEPPSGKGEAEARQEISQLETTVAAMERLIDEAEREAAHEGEEASPGEDGPDGGPAARGA